MPRERSTHGSHVFSLRTTHQRHADSDGSDMTEATWPSRTRYSASRPLLNADSKRHSVQRSDGSECAGAQFRGFLVVQSCERRADRFVRRSIATNISVWMSPAIMNPTDCRTPSSFSTRLSSRGLAKWSAVLPSRPNTVYELRGVVPAPSKMSNRSERVTRSWPCPLLLIVRTTCIFGVCSAPGSARHCRQSTGHVSRRRARSV